jgi:hypothetical protein
MPAKKAKRKTLTAAEGALLNMLGAGTRGTKGRSKTRITAQQAARAAGAYLSSLVRKVHNLTVEETELSENGRFWLITLGFDTSALTFGPREYKVIRVDAHTADVLSMKIRQG